MHKRISIFSGSSSHIQKILKSTEKQESEKRIKMLQELVEVLERNAKSKKCSPVEAGLCKLKARKLHSRNLYSGCIFTKKMPKKPPTVPIGFDFEMEKTIKQRETKRVLEDKHFKFMWSLAFIIPCYVLWVYPIRKKFHSLSPGLLPLFGRREPQNPPKRMTSSQ